MHSCSASLRDGLYRICHVTGLGAGPRTAGPARLQRRSRACPGARGWPGQRGLARQGPSAGYSQEGTGTAFVGPRADLLHHLLGILEDYIPVGIALLGHEAPDSRSFGDVAAKPRSRRALDSVVHSERW